jgi:hypothetical protein
LCRHLLCPPVIVLSQDGECRPSTIAYEAFAGYLDDSSLFFPLSSPWLSTTGFPTCHQWRISRPQAPKALSNSSTS